MGTGSGERAVGYLCAATEIAAAEATTRLERWAAGAGVQVERIFEDVSSPPCSSILERQGFADALRHLHRHGAALLVVGDPRELGSGSLAWPLAHALVRRLGARLDAVLAAEPPQSRFARVSIGELSDTFLHLIEYERRLPILARMDEKGARGERRGRHPPYGYRLSEDGRRLEPDEREQEMLALVARLSDKQRTYREIGLALTDAGFSPRSAQRWHPTTIRKLVQRTKTLE